MIKRKKYRQRWIPGAVVQIDLGDGNFGYGQVLRPASVVFFDCRTKGDSTPDLQEIVNKPIIFKIAVMKYCITQYWKVIGKEEISPEMNKPEDKYTYDSVYKKFEIWKGEGGRISATWEECQHLECAAVWEPHAVEQRLRDHFAGRPCFWVESDKPDWKPISAKEFYKQYDYNYIDEYEEQTNLSK